MEESELKKVVESCKNGRFYLELIYGHLVDYLGIIGKQLDTVYYDGYHSCDYHDNYVSSSSIWIHAETCKQL